MLRRDLGPTLTSFLEARYPFIALRSQEEERVLGLLSAVCGDLGHRLVPISLTAARREDESATALTCLDSMAGQVSPTVFAMLDFHPYLSDPLVVRTLRDMRMRLEKNNQMVVFVSPDLIVPEEPEGLLGLVTTEGTAHRRGVARQDLEGALTGRTAVNRHFSRFLDVAAKRLETVDERIDGAFLAQVGDEPAHADPHYRHSGTSEIQSRSEK